MAVKRRRLFPGTNRSNVMGPIACLAFTSEHHNLLPWKLKRDVYSQAAKVACRVGGAGPEGSEKTERANTTVEPLTYHGYTRTVWEELLHCHSAAGMIDLTVGAGYAAEAALHLKVPYVGLVQTPTHELVVRRYLFRRLWDLMNEPGSAHFEPQLHALLADVAKDPPKDGKAAAGKDASDKVAGGGKDANANGGCAPGKAKTGGGKAKKTEPPPKRKAKGPPSNDGGDDGPATGGGGGGSTAATTKKGGKDGLLNAIKKLAALKRHRAADDGKAADGGGGEDDDEVASDEDSASNLDG